MHAASGDDLVSARCFRRLRVQRRRHCVLRIDDGEEGEGRRLRRRVRRAIALDVRRRPPVAGPCETARDRTRHLRREDAINGYFITGIAAGVLGIAIGAGGAYTYENRELLAEQAAHAKDNERHASDLNAISKAALDAEQRAIDAHNKAEAAISAADAQITKEKDAHETDNLNYRAALAAGTERVRVAVRNCSATGGGIVAGSPGATGVGDGAAAIADLDPAVAERVFGVAGDDQREID